MATSIGSGFVISPAIKDFGLWVPGKTYTGEFLLVNNTNKKVEVDLEYYDVSQENGIPLLREKGPEEYSIRDWLHLCCKKVIVPPNSSKKISYTITVPKSIYPGGKYGVIVAKIVGGRKDIAGLSLNEGLGHVIIGASNVKAKRDSVLDYFTVNKKLNLLWPIKKTKFFLKITNQGNVHERIKGYLYIYKNKPTNTIDIQALNKGNTVILPGTYRVYSYDLEIPPLVSFKDKKISINLKALVVGKYYALARVKHYQHNKLVTEERVVSFWILPWYFILLILILLVIIMRYGLRNKGKNR